MLEFLTYLYARFLPHPDEDRGATMVEYALIVAAIALVVVVGAALFGDALYDFFESLDPSGPFE